MDTDIRHAVIDLQRSVLQIQQTHEDCLEENLMKSTVWNKQWVQQPPFPLASTCLYTHLTPTTKTHVLILLTRVLSALSGTDGRRFVFKVAGEEPDLVIQINPTFACEIAIFVKHPLTGKGMELVVNEL